MKRRLDVFISTNDKTDENEFASLPGYDFISKFPQFRSLLEKQAELESYIVELEKKSSEAISRAERAEDELKLTQSYVTELESLNDDLLDMCYVGSDGYICNIDSNDVDDNESKLYGEPVVLCTKHLDIEIGLRRK